MTWVRRAALGLVLAGVAAASPASIAHAAPAPPLEHVTVVLVPGTSLAELLRIPDVATVARAGGAALMSSEVLHADEGTGAYLTLGAGARSAGPPQVGSSTSTGLGGAIVDMDAIEQANEGHAVPGLLGSVVAACADGSLGGLVAMNRAGHYGLVGADPCDVEVVTVDRTADISGAIRDGVASWEAGPGRIIVVAPAPSQAMRDRGQELTPIVMADGTGDQILHASGPSHALTSDTTHQIGVVSNEDVAPTILDALGRDAPAEMKGRPIRVADLAAPLEVEHRYLRNLEVRVPSVVAGGIGLLTCLGFGVVVSLRRDRVSSRVRLLACGALFAAPAIAGTLILGGWLPVQNLWTVGGTLLVAGVALPWIALRGRGRGVLVPPLILGAIILGAFVAEVAAGGDGMRFTLLGATSLDGGRFFGLHNVAIGLLLGSALFVAASLRTWVGTLVIIATAALLGLPWTGSNLGAGVTLLAAAGMWPALRSTRAWWQRVVAGIAIFGMGMAVTLVAHRYLASTPTHGTRFVEVAGSDPSAIVSIFWSRLQTGINLLVLNPGGLPYLIATPVLLWLVIRPRGGYVELFARFPAWRHALLTILWSCVVAYLFNDTGVAAVGLGFVMALVGVCYVPLAVEPEMMEAP